MSGTRREIPIAAVEYIVVSSHSEQNALAEPDNTTLLGFISPVLVGPASEGEFSLMIPVLRIYVK